MATMVMRRSRQVHRASYSKSNGLAWILAGAFGLLILSERTSTTKTNTGEITQTGTTPAPSPGQTAAVNTAIANTPAGVIPAGQTAAQQAANVEAALNSIAGQVLPIGAFVPNLGIVTAAPNNPSGTIYNFIAGPNFNGAITNPQATPAVVTYGLNTQAPYQIINGQVVYI